MHPLVVIHIYQGAQDILRTRRICVLEGKHHHGSLLSGHCRAESGGIALPLGRAVDPAHSNVILPGVDIIGRRQKHYLPYGCGHGVAQRPIDTVFPYPVTSYGKIFEHECAVPGPADPEREGR